MLRSQGNLVFQLAAITAIVRSVEASNSTFANSTTTDKELEAFVLNYIRDQIHCYALPYGAIGCISHLLTYYCLVINALGRKPLMPWKPQEYAWLNVVIGVLQLAGSCYVASRAITRCQGIKEMQLLGIWMILTSVAAGIASIFGNGLWIGAKKVKTDDDEETHNHTEPDHAQTSTGVYPLKTYNHGGYSAVPLTAGGSRVGIYQEQEVDQSTEHLTKKERKARKKLENQNRKFYGDKKLKRFFRADGSAFVNGGNRWGLWASWGAIILVWLAGCAMGAYGSVLIALKVFLISDISHVWKITVGFFALPVLVAFFWALSCVTATRGKEWKECASLFVFAGKICLIFLVAMLIYMDWLLAAVTENWIGNPRKLPKDGQLLYWLYFGIKRLAFFSS